MVITKSYTDIEQSKKLAKILPIESADMYWIHGKLSYVKQYPTPYIIGNALGEPLWDEFDLPCWSLEALLNVLPNDNSKCTTITRGRYNTITRKYISGWCVYYNEINGANCMNVFAENPVDACVAMIEKLNELKML